MRRIYVGDGGSFVWQWQPKEHIVLEDYPDGVFVRYANCDTVEAPVVQTRREGDKLVADIPPELMQVDKDITVYVCNEDGIIHCHFLSVISSPKPSSYVYEPVEVLRYESLAERIRLIEEWIAAGGGGGGIREETDPTVPEWAKQSQKPTYTAQEVGAMPAGTKIPAKTSDLSNDSGFITKSVGDLVNYYTKTQTKEMISQIPKFRISVVQELPAAGEELVLYLVPFATAEGQYLEYIWVDGRFEVIGSQKVDLTGYATEEWVQAGYQPKGDYALAASVPTKVSQLLNDAGYLTQHQDISHLLPRNLGAENVGKVLVVGGDGNIVLTELPQGGDVTGTLDENNNILLSGDLAEGTYTLKWKNADGTYSDAGTIVVAPVGPAYTNQIPISTEADGSPYNGGQGWKTDWRLSASSGSESSAPGVEVTGFIPYVMADEVIYIKGIEDDGTHAMVAYDEAHAKVWNLALGNFGAALDGSVAMLDVENWMSQGIGLEQRQSVRYIRICANVINDQSILTVNEPIV